MVGGGADVGAAVPIPRDDERAQMARGRAVDPEMTPVAAQQRPADHEGEIGEGQPGLGIVGLRRQGVDEMGQHARMDGHTHTPLFDASVG